MRGAPPRPPRGWERLAAVPSEATFSRAFAEFAGSALPSRPHEAPIERTDEDRLVGYISRDATAIKAREKPLKEDRPRPEKPKRKRGRPRKGEERESHAENRQNHPVVAKPSRGKLEIHRTDANSRRQGKNGLRSGGVLQATQLKRIF